MDYGKGDRHMQRLAARAVILIGMALSLGACTRIGPGHVGIVVSMAGSNKGVNEMPTTTGWTFYNPIAANVYEYPTFVQTAVWTHSPTEGKPMNEEITFTTADQLQVAADISLAYQLNAGKVPAFYVKFRSDNLDQFTHGFLRNLAREKFDNVAGKYRIEQIMGDNGPFLAEVRNSLQAALDPIGVELQQFGFIGAPRPPQSVIDAINAKVQATQLAAQKENEIRQAQAEAAKEVAKAEGYANALAKRSQAEADANLRIAKSITPELVEWQKIQRWNGALPTVSSAATPFVTIK
jgi:regulator of protease activity HflC (stomatin/prohibitin superfamily)